MKIADVMKEKLRQELEPSELEIIDESHLHKGHAGWHEGGESHFMVEVISEKFLGVPIIERHKMIYEILKDEICNIHALRINARAP